MKPYFGRQVIERERRGSSNPSIKIRHTGRYDEDGDWDGPNRIPISRHAVDRFCRKIQSKDFTDVLGPVRGYLFSKVGCQWDDVYSELCRELGSGSEPMAHILYVHILSRRTKELDFRWAGNQFYVDDNGLLQVKIDSWRRRWRNKKEPVRKIQIDDKDWFVEIKGIWYIGCFVQSDFIPMAERVQISLRRRLLGEPVVWEPVWPHYETGWGKDKKYFRFIKHKQANKKELKLKDQLLASKGN